MSFIYYGQLIIGPSGSGKSTYCSIIQKMAEMLKRNIIVINLDPAAETLPYNCHVNIKDLITLEDAMKNLKLGPNGGLVYCMEYLLENFDWLEEKIAGLLEDDYILFDCPGQLELYSHLDTMTRISKALQKIGFSMCSVCLLDVTFLNDEFKWIAGTLASLSFMVTLGLPHLSVLSKCDLVQDKKWLKKKLKTKDSFFIEENEKKEDEKSGLESNFEKKYSFLKESLENIVD